MRLVQWSPLVKFVNTVISGSVKVGEFLDQLSDCQLWRKALLCGVSSSSCNCDNLSPFFSEITPWFTRVAYLFALCVVCVCVHWIVCGITPLQNECTYVSAVRWLVNVTDTLLYSCARQWTVSSIIVGHQVSHYALTCPFWIWKFKNCVRNTTRKSCFPFPSILILQICW